MTVNVVKFDTKLVYGVIYKIQKFLVILKKLNIFKFVRFKALAKS